MPEQQTTSVNGPRHILVTGGAGFIGSHLVDRLLGAGHRVTCFDNFDTFYDPVIKHRNIASATDNGAFTLVNGDLREPAALDRAFTMDPVDTVVHLAARAGVRPSILQPELYYDVNVTGTLRLLEAMRRHEVSRLVFASSSSVYGNNERVPFVETDRVDNPISPYAASKKAGELLCHTYYHLYGMDVYCLRFFTVYGPRQRPEMAIHQFVRKIANGEPIVMFGDGSMRRDFTYIDDIVDGLAGSIEAVRGYEIINLGESTTITLSELIRAIEKVLGKKAVVRREPPQPGDVNVTFADIRKARKLLGYDPHTLITDGLREFVAWYATATGKVGDT